jgi:hypothetical protein
MVGRLLLDFTIGRFGGRGVRARPPGANPCGKPASYLYCGLLALQCLFLKMTPSRGAFSGILLKIRWHALRIWFAVVQLNGARPGTMFGHE